ncbi:hypothetical protein P154DRAFT_525749 [Amniculicola lignicola CBS 123094]|uniref:Uncharacterized protein n=1 Tax=Amniculicola lignicola CBS 123094 TaxID=1392246 RepID=A0A6A5W4J6_9PLEO|nr:hypothetical protein P154DRAFT_525749 [Amniculicola lignicola CBS 123094]
MATVMTFPSSTQQSRTENTSNPEHDIERQTSGDLNPNHQSRTKQLSSEPHTRPPPYSVNPPPYSPRTPLLNNITSYETFTEPPPPPDLSRRGLTWHRVGRHLFCALLCAALLFLLYIVGLSIAFALNFPNGGPWDHGF